MWLALWVGRANRHPVANDGLGGRAASTMGARIRIVFGRFTGFHHAIDTATRLWIGACDHGDDGLACPQSLAFSPARSYSIPIASYRR